MRHARRDLRRAGSVAFSFCLQHDKNTSCFAHRTNRTMSSHMTAGPSKSLSYVDTQTQRPRCRFQASLSLSPRLNLLFSLPASILRPVLWDHNRTFSLIRSSHTHTHTTFKTQRKTRSQRTHTQTSQPVQKDTLVFCVMPPFTSLSHSFHECSFESSFPHLPPFICPFCHKLSRE